MKGSRAEPIEASWATSLGRLEIREAEEAGLREASDDLASFYNDPYNAALLDHTITFTAGDVEELWQAMVADRGTLFLLFRDGVLVGDASFRVLRRDLEPTRDSGGRSAELGVLIGRRAEQGMGLGRRFLRVLLRLAFGPLGKDRLYVAIRPENAPSLRLFKRAGFTPDDSPAARACAERDDEVCMVLDVATFSARQGALAEAEANV